MRGKQRDLEDPRAKSLLGLISAIERVRPFTVALENVHGFRGSRARALLLETLSRSGYMVRERILCPTELGVPNKRPRYYLVASLGALDEWRTEMRMLTPIEQYIHSTIDNDDLRISDEIREKYHWAMSVIDHDARDQCSSCFTSAYGRSWAKSGSFIRTRRGVRRFSPREILGLLHFDPAFRLPAGLPLDKAYSLIGNSVSVIAVRAVLSIIPELAGRMKAAAP
jgi:DNA (cytosine-5)-methyltransferase 1/tRNA (cytosine38-C5)-methyltransferase